MYLNYMIPFTQRELSRAWAENHSVFASVTSQLNAHRLLLLYSVECGLKALLLKRLARTHTKDCNQVTDCRHDINRLLDTLCAGKDLKLKNANIEMLTIFVNGRNEQRFCRNDEINQLWRYGGKGANPHDEELTSQLLKISNWIAGELR